MNTNEISKHLYNDDLNEAIKYINNIKDEETLFVYANNYNWDNGFEIPEAIIENKYCSISVALLLFDLADGISFLKNKGENSHLPDWSSFIKKLYAKVIKNEFASGKVRFSPELTKVQLYKLKKQLPENDQIFITEIEGKDYYIAL